MNRGAGLLMARFAGCLGLCGFAVLPPATPTAASQQTSSPMSSEAPPAKASASHSRPPADSVARSHTQKPPAPQDESSTPAASGDLFNAAVKPMIQGSCSKCHNETAMTAGLDLTRFLKMSAADALKDRDLWEEVASRVGSRQMPPASMPKLAPQQIAGVTHWVEEQYALQDAEAIPDPGSVTARRLNRHEYNNSVRDLLQVNLNASADFPPDPYAYGFDNIGEALTLSPALTEMYWKVAQRIAKAAIPTGPPPPVISTKYDAAVMGQSGHLHIQAVHEAPMDAEYLVKASWDQLLPKGTILTGRILVDGREVVKHTFVYELSQARIVESPKVQLSQGPHKIEAIMQVAPDSQQPAPFKGRLPFPTALEVVGPYNAAPFEQTASYRQIFFKGPPRAGQQSAYARDILERLAFHAYRRPATKAEVDRLVLLTNVVRQHGGDFYKQIQVALEGILMSPNFLFRIERDPTGEGPHLLSEYELASRLSYFLWSSMPDDELLTLAAGHRLHEADTLHAQVRRMLADPKADALAVNFSGEWLQTQNLAFETPDAKTFPHFDAELRDAMQTETRMFFTAVMRDDRSILEFLNGKYTFLNERLARFYGIPEVSGPQFRRVSLEGTPRIGILTQASVLTATSYPTRTSPTVRGKWILANILNTPPPEPPANVPSLASSGAEGKATSIRERLNLHRANPVCASCHSGMDPLGFALENYNGIGEYRQTVDGLPVDAFGEMPDGTTFTGSAQLEEALMKQSGKFVNCLSEKLLTYSIGRGLNSSDQPAVRHIEHAINGNGYRFSALVDAIVDSAPFQMRRPKTAAPPTAQPVALGGNPLSSEVHRGVGHE